MQPSSTELILIRVTGEDRPGLTASVTEILAKYDATILDIGQADIHNTLSLGILFKSEERHSGFIMKELLFKASSLGVTIRFEPITTEQYENWVGMQGKNRYILTVLGRKLSARQISAATSILAEQGMNISDMTNKSRDKYAYTLLDLEHKAEDSTIQKLNTIKGVLRVRVVK